MPEIQAEAEEKKRAAEEKKMVQIEAAKDQAKIQAEKELALKEELKAKDHASTSVDPPPCNRDAKSPKLPAFIDEKDEICSNRLRFEC